MKVRLRLGQKLLLLFLAASVLPLLIASSLILHTAQNDLKTEAASRLRLLSKSSADQVNSFISAKVNLLIFQSQTTGVSHFDPTAAAQNLGALVKQDSDIRRAALINKTGQEQIVLDQNGLIAAHQNVADSDPFKAVNFLAGKEYIGPVEYDAHKKPHIIIAVPLIRFTVQQDLTHLSTAEFGHYRSPDDIQGVLEADFSLDSLWQSVLSARIGPDGYAYVVDDKGNLIAHPDPNFAAANHNLANVHEVEDALGGVNDVHQSESETGVQVLSGHSVIDRTHWIVVAEEPVASVYARVNQIIRFGLLFGATAVLLAIALSLFFSGQVARLVRQLASGARRIGSGDFGFKIPISSNDELGELAQSFNAMGHDLQDTVTNLQHQNLTLEAERNKLNAILNSMNDGVIALDGERKIALINLPAIRLAGPRAEHLTGQPVDEVFGWTRDGRRIMPIATDLVTQFSNLTLAQSDDRIAYCDLAVAKIADDPSGITTLITIHDTTASRELEAMKLDFVAMAAHELRTPLTAVRGYLDLIKQDMALAMPIADLEYLSRAIVSGDRLSNLINNLLNVSKIERDALTLKQTKLDFAATVVSALTTLTQAAKTKSVDMSFDGPKSGIWVAGDASALTEVINNMVGNAIKYTPSGGQVSVRVMALPDHVEFAVTDTGPGIPTQDIPNLFTKFFRVKDAKVSGEQGTGLGLYISRAIVNLHGGSVTVDSEVDKGSTFGFRLPLFDPVKHHDLIKAANAAGGVHGWIIKRSASRR